MRPLTRLIAALGTASVMAAPTADPVGLAPANLGLTQAPLMFDGHGNNRAKASTSGYLQTAAAGQASSRDALFDDEQDQPSGAERPAPASADLKGYIQADLARTTGQPQHWSKRRLTLDMASQGRWDNGIKWHVGGRMAYDDAYRRGGFYNDAVAKDQRLTLKAGENYLDVGAGEWDFRLGSQHVVWGEMVGLYFADVVSPRDLREFILPDFDAQRIPQWAGRAEYFNDDFHAELLWIPVASYDDIGKPGADFFPYPPTPPGVAVDFRHEQRPSRTWGHGNYGLRLSSLRDGWDLSGFLYSSMDVSPAFYRTVTVSPQPAYVYEAHHDRIDQVGGTLAKDFDAVVLKAEAVYTRNRKFSVLRLNDVDGLVAQNTLDWAVGLDFTPIPDTRLNLQFFQRYIPARDADIVPSRRESGYSLLLNHKLTDQLTAEMLWISSLNRTDWLLRPKLSWAFQRNWRWVTGADVFYGPPLGVFGQYNAQDRVYTELRYSY